MNNIDNSYFVEIVKSLKPKVNQSQLAENLNLSKGYISDIFNNKKVLTDEVILRFENFYNIKLNMFSESSQNDFSLKNEVNQISNDNYMMVEYADLSASAGTLGGAILDNLPDSKIRLVPKEYEKGNYLVVRVNGDSMNDGTLRSLIDGDEILIQEHFLHTGDKLPIRNNLFVIVSNEGSVIKQITEHNTSKNTITCHSFNPVYEDFKLNLDDVYQIFIYKKIIRRKPLY
ncbi:LexA family transcriptional regulator [Empedobacter brevis]|uniref:LexA family transcriptional regulator n=1 Tax=Empedobacter brevis TaxID=247 RepID=UPI0028D7F870|nr:LexA family transcriptional regulator [Empedobacter brevis]